MFKKTIQNQRERKKHDKRVDRWQEALDMLNKDYALKVNALADTYFASKGVVAK